MSKSQFELLEALFTALNSEHGVVVSTSNPVLFKQKAYMLMKEHAELSALTLATSRTDPNGEVWIVKKRPSDDQPAEAHPEPTGGGL